MKSNILQFNHLALLIFTAISNLLPIFLAEEQQGIPADFNIKGTEHIYLHSKMMDKIKESEITYFVYYYHPESANSVTGVGFIRDILPKLEYIAEVLFVNCPLSEYSEKDVCIKPEGVKDGFPRMVLLLPPKVRVNPYTGKINNYTEKKYTSQEVSPKSIYKFITDNIPDYSTTLNNDNIDTFLSDYDYNKLLLFTDKDYTPLLFRGLSGKFYDKLKFGLIKVDQKDILSRFKIMRFPTLLMYTVIDEGVTQYSPALDIYNGETNGKDLSEALSFLALPEKRYVTLSKGKESVEYKKTPTSEETTTKQEGKTKDSTVEDDNQTYKKYFGVKSIVKATAEFYMNRYINRPIIFIFRAANTIDQSIVDLAKLVTGFIGFLEFNCLEENVNKFVEETMKFKCPELTKNAYYYFNPPEEKKNFNIDSIMGETLHLENPNRKNLEKLLRNSFSSGLNEIISQDYDSVRDQAIRNGKTPFVYLYENVRL